MDMPDAGGPYTFDYKIIATPPKTFTLDNVFFDSGIILKPIDLNLTSVSAEDKATYFKDYAAGKFHSAAGIGLKVGWNENFVISADFGKAFDKQDGNKGFYLGLNYLF